MKPWHPSMFMGAMFALLSQPACPHASFFKTQNLTCQSLKQCRTGPTQIRQETTPQLLYILFQLEFEQFAFLQAGLILMEFGGKFRFAQPLYFMQCRVGRERPLQ
jgi:hypothetical protein